MGSLEARVRSLQDGVLRRLGEALLRGETRDGGPRLHIVGHSIGGLDARLLANPRYHFRGGDRKLRKQILRHLGTVVTLSAPQHGTPIAKRFMRGVPRLVLEGMSLATIVANARRVTDRLGVPGMGLAYTLFQPDVVGHFEGRWNTTLFKSGAGFGRREFLELWRFVASAL